MAKRYCVSCKKELKEGDYHLCANASLLEPEVCEHCGKSTIDPRHLCRLKVSHLAYRCKKCGRVAVDGEFLCEPNSID